MSDCERIEKLLWDYPNLDDREKAELSAHLESCQSCRKAQETIRALRDSRAADSKIIDSVNTASFDDAVMRKIRAQRKIEISGSDNKRFFIQTAVSVGLAAAIVTFMIISISDLGTLPMFRKADNLAPASEEEHEYGRIDIRMVPSDGFTEAPVARRGKMAMAEKKAEEPKTFSILTAPIASPESVNIDAVYLSDEKVPIVSQQSRALISEVVVDTGLIQSAIAPVGNFITVENMPEPLNLIPPEYPVWAKKRGLSSIVWVKAQIDKTGKVIDARVISSTVQGAGFEEAALEAARASTYEPARSNGVPLPVWIMYPVKFIYKQ